MFACSYGPWSKILDEASRTTVYDRAISSIKVNILYYLQFKITVVLSITTRIKRLIFIVTDVWAYKF